MYICCYKVGLVGATLLIQNILASIAIAVLQEFIGFRGVAGGWVTCDIPVPGVQLAQEQLDQQAPLGLHLLVDTMEMDTIEITKKLGFKVWKVVGLSSMQNVDPPKERK